MGMRPRTEFWVGIAFDSLEDYNTLYGRIDGLVGDNVFGKATFEDDEFGYIYCGDEPVGFGTVFLTTDWDVGARPFDMGAIATDVQQTLALTTRAFAEWNIPGTVGPFTTTDYR